MAGTTKAEAGRKGGFLKWAKVSKKRRTEIMRKLARKRWADKILKEKQSVENMLS